MERGGNHDLHHLSNIARDPARRRPEARRIFPSVHIQICSRPILCTPPKVSMSLTTMSLVAEFQLKHWGRPEAMLELWADEAMTFTGVRYSSPWPTTEDNVRESPIHGYWSSPPVNRILNGGGDFRNRDQVIRAIQSSASHLTVRFHYQGRDLDHGELPEHNFRIAWNGVWRDASGKREMQLLRSSVDQPYFRILLQAQFEQHAEQRLAEIVHIGNRSRSRSPYRDAGPQGPQ